MIFFENEILEKIWIRKCFLCCTLYNAVYSGYLQGKYHNEYTAPRLRTSGDTEATPRQHRGGTAYWHCLLDKKALWSSTYKRRALFYAPFFQNNFTMQNLHCEFSLPTMPDCPNSSSLLGLRVWVRPVEFSNFADCELLHSNAIIFGVVGSLTKFENLNSPHTSFTCLRPCYRW